MLKELKVRVFIYYCYYQEDKNDILENGLGFMETPDLVLKNIKLSLILTGTKMAGLNLWKILVLKIKKEIIFLMAIL